ncbi:thiamine pyrophosphate-binding protein [Enemella sp. A6]|uniref:thiamine pyrophosphate-binding protein n=1 Tax=Enemella sp. A6 TaxID=3440152 RepID=UPI003EC024D5
MTEHVGTWLAQAGVEHVFGVIGSGNYRATAAMVAEGAEFHAVRHESAAVGACDGLWRTTGRIGVASVHQGPGFTNALTALGEAAKSRSPLLVVAGCAPAGDLRSTFRADQAAMATAVGAIADRIHSAESVDQDLQRAWQRAVDERRPVLLDLPLDIQDLPYSGGKQYRPAAPTVAARGADVAEVHEALRAARRPLLLAGRGAWLAGAGAELRELADRTGALLATSAHAKDLFAGHPANLGIMGGFSPQWVVDALAEVDLIIAFGCSLTHWTTRADTLVSDRKVIQIDNDPAALRLNRFVDLALVSDVATCVTDLLSSVEGGGEPATVTPVESIWPDAPQGLHPGQVVRELDQLLPAERTVVVDGGHFIGWPIVGLQVPDPSGFIFTSGGFQSIGLGLGAALGAALGRPDRLTVLVAGDGGWQMSLADLETACRLRLKLLVVVLNDSAYGAEVHHFGMDDPGYELVRFPEVDLAAGARGFGAAGITVRSLDDLAAIGEWLQAGAGPLVVDVRIDPTVVGYWIEQDFRH